MRIPVLHRLALVLLALALLGCGDSDRREAGLHAAFAEASHE
jgi:hypothetical protein